ncbi:MAG: outer membrane protein assembly factor BamE [Comamonadaceae bacterium]|nr:MAG: outer membrane protein assembly factor BamE [Comamonadaceae bacterium]
MSATQRYSPRPLLLAFAFACVGLTACSSVKDFTSSTSTSRINPVNWLTPYKVDVIQGNFISKEQVDALKVGMPREQVRGILGTPLVASVFHANRWDYVFTLKRQGVEPQIFKYTVYFDGDRLTRFEGDTMLSETEFIATLDSGRKMGKVPVLEATPEQLEKAAEKGASSTSAPSSMAAPAPANAPPAVYPPLESPRQ